MESCCKVDYILLILTVEASLSNVIEHEDNSSDKLITIGEKDSSIPLRLYQDIYSQINGRNGKIEKSYDDNLLIDFQEIEQLHHQMMQLCSVHNVIASNEVVYIFHEKDRKQQFPSFESFKNHNANATSPTVNITIKYNFSILPTGVTGSRKPQEYVVFIRLTSRVAVLEKLKEDAPSFLRGGLLLMSDVAEIKVEYSDYVVARGFTEAFDEWIKGCKTSPPKKWLHILRNYSRFIPKIMQASMITVLGIFALRSIPKFFSAPLIAENGAAFFVVFSTAAYIVLSIAYLLGNKIEDNIDSYPILSYVKLNRGDDKLIEDFSNNQKHVIRSFIINASMTIILSIIATEIDKLIPVAP